MTTLRRIALAVTSLALALELIGCGDEPAPEISNQATAPATALHLSTTQTTMSTSMSSPVATEVISMVFRMTNVRFDGLVSNSTLLASFEYQVKEAVANAAGAGTLPEHITVEVHKAEGGNAVLQGFLPPSRRLGNATAVDVQVDIHHPEGVSDVVLGNLGAGNNASQAVASALEQATEMAQVVQGPVQIHVVQRPSRIQRGQVWEIPAGNLGNGIGCQDGVDGTGFLMFSSTSVFTRFTGKPPHRDNADHFVCVRYNGEWMYDTNEEWMSFTPASTDVLVASVNFSSNIVTDLRAARGKHHGIEKGYVSGDLRFIAEWWRGSRNPGEFTVTGSGFNPNEYTSTTSTTTTTTLTTTTSTSTSTTVTTSTTSGPRMILCPKAWPLQGGRSCQGNNADSVWKWMADNSFGLGPSYHNTVRPDYVDYSQIPHGACFEFGCVADWRYKQTQAFATLQCKDGAFSVVGPFGFQQDQDHKCT